ncbi:MAG: outer membrane beta-barrel protein [Gemmatimonadetes bacterium]|nr:outer membrane beta-barrel protein [Gemmatimonadota bacterium]MCY3942518.1 outer membrane beta-barrel protein [Gemmatimonadota bacterium]
MKRFAAPLLAAALLLPPGASAFGQTTLTVTTGVNRTSIGVNLARYVYPHFDNHRHPDFRSATGATVGLAVTRPLSGNLSLEVGSLYSKKGTRWKGGSDGVNFEARMEPEYLEVATLLKVGLGLPGSRISAYATAGPAVAFRTSCEWNEVVSIRGLVINEVNARCGRVGLGLSRFDFGLSGGAGVETALSDGVGVSVGVVHTLGLKNVGAHRAGHLKNRAMSLRAGIVTPIG